MSSDKEAPKKQQNRKPTFNQRRVLDKIVEQAGKGGKISVSRAMRDAGYSPKTAKDPKKITATKGWKDLLEEFLPDSLLSERHQALLNRPEIVKNVDKVTGEVTVEATEFLDVQAVKAGLDMAYKLKGHYEAEKHEITGFNLKDLYSSDDK